MINDLDIVQWDYLLSPEFEMINSAGKPLTGGYIEVYIHGTRNKYYCASDFNGTLHPFQIPLDSIGSNVILASPENAYDVYVYNKFGSLIMSRYNVHCQGGNGGPSTYVGDKLFYGQYRASNVTTIANLNRNKGNINLTSNGYLKLKNGMSYHITVRGAFQVDDVTNTDTTLNYIEYTSVNPIKIDIDETKEGPQYFELSYDIYRLPDDMDYQVAFAQSNGMVTELLVEVHSLSNLATSSAGGDQEYEEGWGIDITNNVISVDPSILDDYVTEEELLEIVTGITGIIPEDVATHTEVYEATVTAIEYVTGMIPQSQVQSDWDETDESSPAYIQNKPDLDIYATHDEVNTVSGQIIETVNNVSGDIIETVNNVSGDIIETVNNVSAILHGEIENIPEQQQADWDQTDDTQVDYIKNKPDLSIYATHDEVTDAVTSIDLSEYATHTEVYNSSVTAVQLVTGLIPDVSDFTTHEDVHESIVTAIEYVTGIIPDAQVQSDWTETDTSDPAYIQNKPNEYGLVAGDNIGIIIDNIDKEIVISASATDLSGCATKEELQDGLELVTGLIPDISDFTTHTEVYEAVVTGVQLATSVIPDQLEAGQYISIEDNTINVTGLQPEGDYATNTEVSEAIVTAIETVTALIPEAQVQSDWNQSDNTQVDYIKNKPDLDIYATHDEVYHSSVSSIQLVTGLIPDVSDFTTNNDVHESIVTAIEYVTGIIPDAQVQSNWAETDTTDPSYIQNKPDLSVYTTVEDVISIVSGVTGLTEYGQFYATNISGAATMARTKGTIDVTNDGKIKLKKGSSYHVTVRGRYNQTTAANTYGNISYIEYITGQSINVNVDKTITESQYFELSYDLYKLNNDSNYYIFFSMSGGTVNDLFIEIHSLDGIGGTGTGPVTGGTEYDAGWGIQILNNVISVNPAIIPDISDFTTHDDVYESIVTAIEYVTGAMPADQVQSDWTETDTSDPSYIQNKPNQTELIAGDNIGIFDNGSTLTIAASGTDLTGYATELEVNNAIVTATNYVTGLIPDVSDMATQTWVNNQGFLTSIPDTYATDSEVYDATVTAIQIATSVIPDTSDMATKTWVGNQGYLTSVPDTYATDAEVYNAIVTGVQIATGLIPDISGYATESWVTSQGYLTSVPDTYATDAEVSEAIVTGVQVVTGWVNSQGYLTEVPSTYATDTEVSEAIATATNDMATQTWVGNQGYLTSVPSNYATDTEVSQAIASSITDFVTEDQVTALIPESEEVEFEELDIAQFAQVSAIPVVTGFATKSELSDVEATIPTVQLNSNDQVTAINNHEIAGTGGATYTAGDGIDITNDVISLDQPYDIVAGNNVTITVSGTSAIISAQGGGGGGSTYTAGDYISIDGNDVISVTGLAPVSGSNGITVNDNVVSLNNPVEIVAGNNIEITVTGVSAIISTQGGGGGGTTYTAGQYISIDSNDVISVTGVAAATAIPTLPDTEEVTFEELDLSDYALASAIPDTSNMISYTGNTAINHIEIVAALPGSPDANTLYLIPEA